MTTGDAEALRSAEDKLAEANARISALEEKVEQLLQRVAGAESPSRAGAVATAAEAPALEPAAEDRVPATPPAPSKSPWTRRALMLGAAAAAVAATDATVRAAPAEAAPGQPMIIGGDNQAGASLTDLVSANDYWTLQVVNNGAGTGSRAISAHSPTRTGASATTNEGTALHCKAFSSGTALQVESQAGVPLQFVPAPGNSPASGTWPLGAMLMTPLGELWVCVAAGSPGSWRLLASPDSAGAYRPITPARAYDSRAPLPSFGKPLTSGTERTISVRYARNPETGAVIIGDLVPPGTRAITINATITQTTATGFISIAPGNVAAVTASSLNWTGDGQTVANGLTVGIDAARNLKAFCGGGGSTHLIVDVTGYFCAT